MTYKLNVIGLNRLSFVTGQEIMKKKAVVVPDGEYFQFDVTPLDSNYPLIS